MFMIELDALGVVSVVRLLTCLRSVLLLMIFLFWLKVLSMLISLFVIVQGIRLCISLFELQLS